MAEGVRGLGEGPVRPKKLGTKYPICKPLDGVAEAVGKDGNLEYLLIADSEERRFCRDPMKKAKRAEFLRRYSKIREGKPRQNVVESSGKTIRDVAEAIGEDERTVQRLLKLNDLIPELQALVSQDKLSQTAA